MQRNPSAGGLSWPGPRQASSNACCAGQELTSCSGQARADGAIQSLNPAGIIFVYGLRVRVILEVRAVLVENAIGLGGIGNRHDGLMDANVESADNFAGFGRCHLPAVCDSLRNN